MRDVASGEVLVGCTPTDGCACDTYEAIFSEARAGVSPPRPRFETHTEIVVSPEDDIELRRVRITNLSRTARAIEVTSYAEVVLASAAADALASGLQQSVRSDGDPGERAGDPVHAASALARGAPPWIFHLMTVHGGTGGKCSYETDRCAFIGRGRTWPLRKRCSERREFCRTQGSVLDPIVAIRRQITLDAGRLSRSILSLDRRTRGKPSR